MNTKAKVMLLLKLLCIMSAMLEYCRAVHAFNLLPKRLPNRKRKREESLEHLRSFNDVEFKSQTGLSRRIFNYLLQLITPHLEVNQQQAINSSGSPIPVPLKLFIHQRLLKGAKALDTEWMGIDPGHVWTSTWLPVARALDVALDNVSFKADDRGWCEARAREWSFVQQRKYGCNPNVGLVGACDGLIIKIPHLLEEELKETNLPYVRFWNRKGYHALNAQAVCDAYCRFTSFECMWPGSTNDITAYRQSALYVEQMAQLPPEYFLALDEAYKSIKDGQHLTPFSGSDIECADSKGMPEVADAMRAFNKLFCSDRITIERAFGQLVRRWGVLWSALPRRRLREIALLLRVAVKLHNLCVDEWLCERYGYATEEGKEGTGYPMPVQVASMNQELAGQQRAGDAPSLPATDVEQLSTEALLTETALLRAPQHAQDVDTSLPPVQYSATDATVNAGIAMSNWLEEEVNRRASRATARTVHNLLPLREQEQARELKEVGKKDQSAMRRLMITLKVYEEGLRVI